MGAWRTAGVTLGEALNASGVWQTGGDAPWFAETNASGVVSIRSGDITAGQQSWVEVTIDKPAYIDFDSRGDVGLEVRGSNSNFPGSLLLSNETLHSGGGINVVSWGELTINGDAIVMRGMSVTSLSSVIRWTHYGAGITRLDKVAITPDLDTPYIVTPPGNGSGLIMTATGSEITFSVVAGGTDPLSYYWFKDGLLLNNSGRISGATGATIQIASSVAADAGTYSVLVSNTWGTALYGSYMDDGLSYSSGTGVTLSVLGVDTFQLPMPLITEQPLSRMVTNGSTVEFNVTAISTNAPPFQYRWYFGANLILEGTNPVCRLIDVKPADLGNYWVAVNDGLNSRTSMVARLEFLPEFRSSPQRSPASGQFQFQVGGHPGRTTDILASTNLIDWEVIGTVNNSADAQTFADPAAALLRRFYRLRQSAGSP